MNFTEDFRKKEFADIILKNIWEKSTKHVRIMEVCGGHTMAIRKYGIHNLLPQNIELLSGPGCPVCVTGQKYIDALIAYSRQPDIVVLIYGDLLRVPGTLSSLDREKAEGADVRIIYSTIQALEIARLNPQKKIVFAAIGFETTTPATAIAVIQAKKENLSNFFILSAHKIMPPAMGAIMEEGIQINGYIGPGHVCAISGSKIFVPLSAKYHIPIVISGFEPIDILQSILMLTENIQNNHNSVEIQYSRLVSEEGNTKAQRIVEAVFEPTAQHWRGIGPIEASGLRLRKEYQEFDAHLNIPVKVDSGPEPKRCLCGPILKGIKKPTDCNLFDGKCTPSNPVGACMVSLEGACNTWYAYRSIL
jgi:hydrogenase expression/formation protein HypD